MKVRYQFPVASIGTLPIGVSFESGDYFVELIEKDGRFISLALTRGQFPPESVPKFVRIEEGEVKASIVIPDDPFWLDVVRRVRAIEGAISLWGIRHISVEECETSWIPETPEEEGLLTLRSFSRSRGRADSTDPLALDLLVRSIRRAPELEGLEVPLNFRRRGMADVSEERYIDAINDFYFVLETMFADGKFRKRDVVSAMIGHPELLSAIPRAKDGVREVIPLHREIERELLDRYLDCDEEAIIEGLVELRGYLHHHSLKRQDIWHPAEQRGFKADAIFLSYLCHQVVSDPVIHELFLEESMRDFLMSPAFTKDGKRINWTGLGEGAPVTNERGTRWVSPLRSFPARNAKCPCGSGARFKACCGALSD